jgi:hypothetical protein
MAPLGLNELTALDTLWKCASDLPSWDPLPFA